MEWQYISSKSNSLVLRLSKLKDKKYRKSEGLFRFDGIKLFYEAVKANAPIEYVIVSDSAREKYIGEVKSICDCKKLYIFSDDVFLKLTDEQAPEGIITVCSNLDNITKADDLKKIADELVGKRVLMLESVRDVGNMGTIIRSARAFGIDTLAVSSDCADLYNPKTIRAAMGALFVQRIVVIDSVSEAVLEIKKTGARVYATALDREAKRLGEVDFKLGDVILIGNEGHGLSKELIDACDECVYIPMEDGSESLNAGIAASICMWELYKIK